MWACQALGILSPEKDNTLSVGIGSLNWDWGCTAYLS